MPLILGTNSIKDTGYDVANSLRVNENDSPRLHKTNGTPTSRRKFTFSCWLKRSSLDAASDLHMLFNFNGNSNRFYVAFFGDQLRVNATKSGDGTTAMDIKTNRIFRDFSAWYSIVVAVDTEQGTAANRVKIYINGVQETSFATETYPAEDDDIHVNESDVEVLEFADNAAHYFDGYITEIVFIDGSQEAVTSFGEFDEDSGIWKPIKVSGLTFGTNGFYLDFEDSSNLGNDANGGTDFTEVNIVAADQTTDTCTNNFATMNLLDNYYAASTFTEGNLKIVSGGSPYSSNTATFGLSSGKWYYELKYLARGGSEDLWHVGIKSTQDTANDQMLGEFANDYGYRAYNGKVRNNNGDITYGDTFAINDIIGVYIDLDNNKLYFAKNGTIQNSGTGISITAVASTPLGVYFPAISWNDGSTTGTCSLNFGSPIDDTGGNTDANGYGDFEYNPSSGTFDGASKSFYAICTKNLAEFGG